MTSSDEEEQLLNVEVLIHLKKYFNENVSSAELLTDSTGLNIQYRNCLEFRQKIFDVVSDRIAPLAGIDRTTTIITYTTSTEPISIALIDQYILHKPDTKGAIPINQITEKQLATARSKNILLVFIVLKYGIAIKKVAELSQYEKFLVPGEPSRSGAQNNATVQELANLLRETRSDSIQGNAAFWFMWATEIFLLDPALQAQAKATGLPSADLRNMFTRTPTAADDRLTLLALNMTLADEIVDLGIQQEESYLVDLLLLVDIHKRNLANLKGKKEVLRSLITASGPAQDNNSARALQRALPEQLDFEHGAPQQPAPQQPPTLAIDSARMELDELDELPSL